MTEWEDKEVAIDVGRDGSDTMFAFRIRTKVILNNFFIDFAYIYNKCLVHKYCCFYKKIMQGYCFTEGYTILY